MTTEAFFFSSRRRHTRSKRDWSSDVCSSDLVRGFAVCNDEAAFKNPAVNRVESDAHAGVLRWRFETADFLLMRRIGKIENDETVAAKRSVPAMASILPFFRHVDGTVQSRERSL